MRAAAAATSVSVPGRRPSRAVSARPQRDQPAAPEQRPRARIANAVGGSNAVIVDRVGRRAMPKIRTVASPRLPDADRPRGEHPDLLHLRHPAELAGDVGDDRPRRARSGRRSDDRTAHRPPAARPRAAPPSDPIDDASRRRTATAASASSRADQRDLDGSSPSADSVDARPRAISSSARSPSPGRQVDGARSPSGSTVVPKPSRTASRAVALTQ